MDKWLVPDKIPPGRPIVSDCSSDSYHISELIDHFIKPLSNRHPSYVKDTWDLLDKLRDIEVVGWLVVWGVLAGLVGGGGVSANGGYSEFNVALVFIYPTGLFNTGKILRLCQQF